MLGQRGGESGIPGETLPDRPGVVRSRRRHSEQEVLAILGGKGNPDQHPPGGAGGEWEGRVRGTESRRTRYGGASQHPDAEPGAPEKDGRAHSQDDGRAPTKPASLRRRAHALDSGESESSGSGKGQLPE